jgi:RNA polymerase-binding transcription factor DksA
MNKRNAAPDWSSFRQLLLKIRAQLRGDIRQLGDNALLPVDDAQGNSHMPTHPADHGSETYDQEFDLLLLESKDETLGQVDAALERMNAGEYGLCVHCSKVINKKRLEVIPYTPFCVNCAGLFASKPRRVEE